MSFCHENIRCLNQWLILYRFTMRRETLWIGKSLRCRIRSFFSVTIVLRFSRSFNFSLSFQLKLFLGHLYKTYTLFSTRITFTYFIARFFLCYHFILDFLIFLIYVHFFLLYAVKFKAHLLIEVDTLFLFMRFLVENLLYIYCVFFIWLKKFLIVWVYFLFCNWEWNIPDVKQLLTMAD